MDCTIEIVRDRDTGDEVISSCSSCGCITNWQYHPSRRDAPYRCPECHVWYDEIPNLPEHE